MAKTLSGTVDITLRHLGDISSRVWARSEIERYIKDGYDRFCYQSACLWKKDKPASLDDVAGQALYDLPSDLQVIERVTYDDRRIPPASRYELEQRYSAFETQQGTVSMYMVEGDGTTKLRKINIPATSEADTTGIEYTRRGATLSATQDFEIPDRFVKYIRFYAMARALERKGPGQDLKLADEYRARYDAGAAKALILKEVVDQYRVSVLGSGTTPSIGGRLPRPTLPPEYGSTDDYWRRK